MASDEDAGDALSKRVEKLLATHSDTLDPIGATILAAADMGLVRDTRTFARDLGVAHALVIRSVTMLTSELGLLDVDRYNEKSQQVRYRLSDKGRALIAAAQRDGG